VRVNARTASGLSCSIGTSLHRQLCVRDGCRRIATDARPEPDSPHRVPESIPLCAEHADEYDQVRAQVDRRARLAQLPTPARRRQLIIDWLLDHPGLHRSADIADGISLPALVVRRELHVLRADGRAVAHGETCTTGWCHPEHVREDALSHALPGARRTMRAQLLELVEAMPGITAGDVADRCDVQSRYASEELGRLYRQGLLARVRRGRWYYYYPPGAEPEQVLPGGSVRVLDALPGTARDIGQRIGRTRRRVQQLLSELAALEMVRSSGGRWERVA
jgi:predicted transcriptional regulator